MDLKPFLVKSSRNLKGSSINNYTRNIRTLNGGEPFDDLNWLTDTAAILERIKDYITKPWKVYQFRMKYPNLKYE